MSTSLASADNGSHAGTNGLQPCMAKVLIVEDEEDMGQLLAYRLRGEHYQTRVAASGRQACQLLESFRPDCILLDILLPEMDGWQVCSHIRNHADPALASTPIIMLTALGDQEARIRGLELGANGYIAKPYAFREVLVSCAKLIDERRKQQQMQAEIHRLQDENRSSVDLQSLLCHELKNHLSFIQGFVARLEKAAEPPRQGREKKYFDLINRSVGYLLNISDEVLLMRQVETESLNLEERRFSLKESVDEVLQLYHQVAAAKKIVIRTDCPAAIEVRLNRGAFKLILSSLLENAVKYSPANTEILCTIAITGDNRLVLQLADEGIGVPEGEQNKIFAKFYRGKNVRDTSRGTGIGLYSVRMLAEALRGSVSLTSREGCGSCFTVQLPLGKGTTP
ncbi:MAG: response regulator [Thermodesulfobacteriota bacterium]